MGQPGNVELGTYVRTGWGVSGFLISISGAFGTVNTRAGRCEIIELKYLCPAEPDHAVSWLDFKEGDDVA